MLLQHRPLQWPSEEESWRKVSIYIDIEIGVNVKVKCIHTFKLKLDHVDIYVHKMVALYISSWVYSGTSRWDASALTMFAMYSLII